jgi:hypothetical protein
MFSSSCSLYGAAGDDSLTRPRDLVHNESLNVGQTGENYRVRELADMVPTLFLVASSHTRLMAGLTRDVIEWTVAKLAVCCEISSPGWNVPEGVEELDHATT